MTDSEPSEPAEPAERVGAPGEAGTVDGARGSGVVVAVTEVIDLAGLRVAPVLGLLVPADPAEPVRVVLVRAAAAAFSDAIGGGLLDDDTLSGACEGGRFGVYLDSERQEKELPQNGRAAALLARLGHTDCAELAGLRGDALVVGTDVRGGDCDVPAGALVAACQVGQGSALGTDVGAPEAMP